MGKKTVKSVAWLAMDIQALAKYIDTNPYRQTDTAGEICIEMANEAKELTSNKKQLPVGQSANHIHCHINYVPSDPYRPPLVASCHTTPHATLYPPPPFSNWATSQCFSTYSCPFWREFVFEYNFFPLPRFIMPFVVHPLC